MEDESVHLVVTSPPYWNLKRYNEHPDQLGHVQDYEVFLNELEKVWRQVPQNIAVFGDAYLRYREEVPLFVPWKVLGPRRRGAAGR